MTSRALGIALRAGALSLALPAPTVALVQQVTTPALAGADLLATLRAGGHILYFRHPGGRACAVGEAIRALGVPIGAVLASPLCRTVETARLAFGTAQKSAAVREAGPLPPGSPGRFPVLRALLSTPVAPGTNTIVVGHAYPYYTLVGGRYLSEGEADAVRPRGANFEVVARVDLEQSRALAAGAAGR
ncbi:MAG TPA: hypothetical protein VFO08_22095 [Methylomirabilota bacterium]|nr:hypothetical protein [Methylomirabilota bacterium]